MNRNNIKVFTVFIFISIFLFPNIYSLDNGLALRPPMGWMTWERYRCNIDCADFPADCIGETLIKETADRMARDGWLKAGYQYLSIDDCWMSKTRAPNGELLPDPKRFPSGMKALGDYIHSRGLKFGIYGDFGTKTCGGYPGSLFYLQQDANTFAKWGVDYVKFDGCYSEISQQVEGYEVFGFYLNRTGRPMVYSCSWPAYQNSQASLNSASLIKTCNLWRIFQDIQDSFDSVIGIINKYKKNPYNFQSWAGPGHWNDPDMLIIGDFGLSQDQQRLQMAMWAMFAAPLIMSDDLRSISNFSRSLLLNPRLISINQDPAGLQAKFEYDAGRIQVWKRQISSGETVVAFLNSNTGGTPTRYLFVFGSLKNVPIGKNLTVTEVFSGKVLGRVDSTKPWPVVVNPTGVVLLSFH